MNADERTGAPPRKVFLFSGHMIDAPGRESPRFPPGREPLAAAAIARTLDELDAGPADLAFCGGACGGDLLFAEAALARGARLELYIPLDEPAFLGASVDFADSDWRARYFAAKARAILHAPPARRGAAAAGEDPYERNNLRMLEAAKRFGAERIDFICLWNGQQADGPGGTLHLMEEVRGGAGRTHWLDTTKLWS